MTDHPACSYSFIVREHQIPGIDHSEIEQEKKTMITKLASVTIYVNNQDKARDFYTEKLGLYCEYISIT